MKEPYNKRGSRKYYLEYLLWYTGLFLIVFSGIFYLFAKEGKSFVWMTDGLPSYIPNMYYFIDHTKEALGNLLSGNFSFPMYDFNIGFGDNVALHLEPLYWLTLFFKPSQTEYAFDFLMILRFYLAGISMSAFLFYFKNGRLGALTASFAYLCSGYGLYAGFRHAQFVIPMIMLPLCIIAIEEIIREKRWYVLTVVVWIHLWCSYYFTYMNTIAMGCYFLIRFFCLKERRTFREFWGHVRLIIGSYLLGVMIGNTTLVDSFASYLSSSRTGAMDYEKSVNYFSYGLKYVKKCVAYFFGAGWSPGHWLKLGFIPLIYMAVVVLLVKKGKKELKAAAALGTVFCLIPAVGFVFSGFGNINNRWCFIYAFTMAAILGFMVKDLIALGHRELLLTGAAVLPYCALYAYMFFVVGKQRRFSALVCAELVLTFLVLVLVNHKRFPRRLRAVPVLAVMTVTLWVAQYMEFAPSGGGLVEEFADAGEVLNKVTNTPLAVSDQIEDEEFYRAATMRVPSAVQGAAQVLRYNGTVQFDNTAVKTIHSFYRTTGLTSWSLVRLKGLDGRTFLESLASVKYYMLEKGQPYNLPYGYTKVKEVQRNGRDYEIFKNEYALPLGYTYDSVTDEEKLMQYESGERQEVLLQAAVLEDVEAAGSLADGGEDITITGQSLPVTDIRCENAVVTENTMELTGSKEEPAVVTLEFDIPENSEVSLWFKGLRWNSGGNVNISYSCGDYSSSYALHGVNNIYDTKQ